MLFVAAIIGVRDVYDHTIRVIESVEDLRDILSSMLDIYLSSINLTMSHYQMKTSSLDHIKPNTLFAAKSMTANGVTV
jgi:hypothetical protein